MKYAIFLEVASISSVHCTLNALGFWSSGKLVGLAQNSSMHMPRRVTISSAMFTAHLHAQIAGFHKSLQAHPLNYLI